MKHSALTPPMRKLATMLESRTGQVLTEDRLWRLETSLRPVLRVNGFEGLEELVAAIAVDPNGPLARAATDALVNNETSFFRDARVFRKIEQDLLPSLMADPKHNGRPRTLRVWCAGCSTGQEAFSLAMLFANNREAWPDWRLQILATDISGTAVERARSGRVSQMDVQRGLAITDLLRWMVPAGDEWLFDRRLREMIDFRVDNLLSPAAPLGEYDLILCRNVLLYFPSERKRQIFDLLARHCSADGILLLGAGETILGHTEEFVASSKHRGAYERAQSPAGPSFPRQTVPPGPFPA